MSILSTFDFKSNKWVHSVQPEFNSFEYEIGFRYSEGPVVSFDNLKFGFDVSQNGETYLSLSFPPEGVSYIATDQIYLFDQRLTLEPESNATIFVWAENSGIRHESSFVFVVPLPQQPFPSWTWDDGKWAAPVPHPDDDGFYVWNEDEQTWATVDPISEQGDD